MLVLTLLALAASASAQLDGRSNPFGAGIVRSITSKLGIKSETVDRFLLTTKRAPALNVIELTDHNWEAVLRTGTDNPLAEALPASTIWVITVYGQDGVSPIFLNATEEVAAVNASDFGGTLSSDMRFARIDYQTETILPTLFWLWRIPTLVIATNNMQDLRFFPPGVVAPFAAPIAQLLNNRTMWETMPIWTGHLSPSSALRTYVGHLSRAWAFYHHQVSRVPGFIMLMLSGLLLNYGIGLFHPQPTKPKEDAAQIQSSQSHTTESGTSTATQEKVGAVRKR